MINFATLLRARIRSLTNHWERFEERRLRRFPRFAGCMRDHSACPSRRRKLGQM